MPDYKIGRSIRGEVPQRHHLSRPNGVFPLGGHHFKLPGQCDVLRSRPPLGGARQGSWLLHQIQSIMYAIDLVPYWAKQGLLVLGLPVLLNHLAIAEIGHYCHYESGNRRCNPHDGRPAKYPFTLAHV